MTQPRWPSVELVRVPRNCGLGPGDLIVVAPDRPIWIEFGLNRKALALTVTTTGEPPPGPQLRAGQRGFERCDTRKAGAIWRPDHRPPKLKGAELRLVDDGPCLGIPRLVLGRLLVQPRWIEATGATVSSRWTGVGRVGEFAGVLVDVDVGEGCNGEWTVREFPRRRGVDSRDLVKACGGTLDPERAATIARCHPNRHDSRWIGFDGEIRNYEGRIVGPEIGDGSVFASLCGSVGNERDDWDRFHSITPAPREAVAQLVRELFPVAWAREEHFLAECAALFGDDVVRASGPRAS